MLAPCASEGTAFLVSENSFVGTEAASPEGEEAVERAMLESEWVDVLAQKDGCTASSPPPSFFGRFEGQEIGFHACFLKAWAIDIGGCTQKPT